MDRAELNHALSNKRTDKKGGFLKSRSSIWWYHLCLHSVSYFLLFHPYPLVWLTLACIACLLLQRSQRSFTLGNSIRYPVSLCALLFSQCAFLTRLTNHH